MRINIALGVLLVAICATVGSMLLANWRSDKDRASLEAGNIAAAIAQDVQRNIELFDLSIQGAAEWAADPFVMAASKEMRQAILFDRSATAPFLGRILVLGPTGTTLASSAATDPAPQNYADRDFFRIHAQQPSFGLYISRPLVSHDDGQTVIVLSRRITNRDGSFGGVVTGTLLADYFHQLFRQIRLGPNGSLSLFRTDGTLMMREPWDPGMVGVRHYPPALLNAASRSSEGGYETRSVIDDVPRLFRFRRVGTLPLVASVGFALSDIHREFWRRAALIGAVVAVCCLSIVLLNARLARELRRRIEAEAALTALVDTDGLTGLANRRCFDRVLRTEWRRGARPAQPLTLLMVDADHFKAYNDRFGHAAGDDILRRIAECLSRHTRRAGELAARYGGEEFAAILPGLGRDDAARVADALRRAVLQLDVPHPGSPLGQISVSIGCATLVPSGSDTAEDLMAAADAALYAAKRAGRNAICAAGAVPLRLAS